MERGKGLGFEVRKLDLYTWLHHVPNSAFCMDTEEHTLQGAVGMSKRQNSRCWWRAPPSMVAVKALEVVQVVITQERGKEMLFLLKQPKNGGLFFRCVVSHGPSNLCSGRIWGLSWTLSLRADTWLTRLTLWHRDVSLSTLGKSRPSPSWKIRLLSGSSPHLPSYV